MKYNGMELEEVKEPQVFDGPTEMLAWGTGHPTRRLIVAILPGGIAVDTDRNWLSHCAYIPKKAAPRRATNRELSKWLVQGNGEMTFKSKSERDIDHLVFASHCYEEEYADEECDKALKRNDDGSWIVVRKWEDADWHEPTADYLGLEDK